MTLPTETDINLPARAGEASHWPTLPLLQGESGTDFDRLLQAFVHEVEPRGAVEDMYVRDIARIVWEMLRLRRCETAMINAGFCGAIEAVASRLMEHLGEPYEPRRQKAAELARQWFVGDRHEVLKLLGRFELDESALEAEAIRRSSRVLEPVEKALMALEARRDKALGCIAFYRASFARKVRETAARMVEAQGREVARLPGAGAAASAE